MREREKYLKKAALITHIYDNADFPKAILQELFPEEKFTSESLQRYFMDFESIELPATNANSNIVLQYAYNAFLSEETKSFVDKVFGDRDLFLKNGRHKFKAMVYSHEKELSDEQFETLYQFIYQRGLCCIKYKWFINEINKIFEKGYRFIYDNNYDASRKRSRLSRMLSSQYKPDSIENMHGARMRHVKEFKSSIEADCYREKSLRRQSMSEKFRNYIRSSYPQMTETNLILDTIMHSVWLYWAIEICRIPCANVRYFIPARCHPMLINSYLALANEIFYFMNLEGDIVEVEIEGEMYKIPKYLLIISDNKLIKYLTDNGLHHADFKNMDDSKLEEISNNINVNMKTLHSIQEILNDMQNNENYMHELFMKIVHIVNYPSMLFKEEYM